MIHYPKKSDQSRQFLQQPEIHTLWESDYLNPYIDRFYDNAFGEILGRIRPSLNDRILDAGCGYGYHTIRIARCGAQVTAVDFSDVALAKAHNRINNAGLNDQVTVAKADLTDLPFQDSSFHHVISWGVIMHIPDMQKALLELDRVLKPSGFLVLGENNVHSLDVTIRERAINVVKALVGRTRPQITRLPCGVETWLPSQSGALLVRKTDMRYLTKFFSDKGYELVARTAGQFTEAYTNMPNMALKRLVFALNEFYFKRIRIPQLALGNILYFRKFV